MEKLKISVTLPAAPQKIYEAWLNSKQHSAIIGDKATASAKVKGKFSAWDGYITGHNVELQEGKKIVQSWRTTEFPVKAPDSVLELRLAKKAGNKTTFTLIQTGIPKGQGKKYKNGWKEHYFEGMKAYFKAKK